MNTSHQHQCYCAWIGIVAIILGVANQATATEIFGGFDHFESKGMWDFSQNPIPPDFFGPGSLEFDGQVPLQGIPVNNGDTTDTLVRRPMGSMFPGGQDTIPAEIVALS